MGNNKLRLMAIVPLDLIIVFGLVSCGDQISDVVNAISNEAVAVATQSDQSGLVASSPSPSSEAFHIVSASNGQLSAYQTLTLTHLAWPQTHKAIEDALGRPHTRDLTLNRDYYTLPNGHTATIHYHGGKAISYSLGDSGE